MSGYVGDFAIGASVTLEFNTQNPDGSAITLAGTPVVSVYKQGSTTEVTTGVTLTVDYDSRTGNHRVVIDTSSDGAFYAAGNDFFAKLAAGTVGDISVAGKPVGHFSLQNRYLTLATIAAAVWGALTAGITTANSIGKRILDFVTTLVYVAPTTPPTVSEFLTGLLVDGPTNKLKVNADHSVNSLTTVDTQAIADAVVQALTESGVTVDEDSQAAIVTGVASALATAKTLVLRRPPVNQDLIELTVGDSYYSADGNALEWTLNDGTLPSFVDAIVGLYLDPTGTEGEALELLKEGSVVTATGSTRVLRVELDPADFADLPLDTQMKAEVKVTLSSRVVTRVKAVCVVSA